MIIFEMTTVSQMNDGQTMIIFEMTTVSQMNDINNDILGAFIHMQREGSA